MQDTLTHAGLRRNCCSETFLEFAKNRKLLTVKRQHPGDLWNFQIEPGSIKHQEKRPKASSDLIAKAKELQEQASTCNENLNKISELLSLTLSSGTEDELKKVIEILGVVQSGLFTTDEGLQRVFAAIMDDITARHENCVILMKTVVFDSMKGLKQAPTRGFIKFVEDVARSRSLVCIEGLIMPFLEEELAQTSESQAPQLQFVSKAVAAVQKVDVSSAAAIVEAVVKLDGYMTATVMGVLQTLLRHKPSLSEDAVVKFSQALHRSLQNLTVQKDAKRARSMCNRLSTLMFTFLSKNLSREAVESCDALQQALKSLQDELKLSEDKPQGVMLKSAKQKLTSILRTRNKS